MAFYLIELSREIVIALGEALGLKADSLKEMENMPSESMAAYCVYITCVCALLCVCMCVSVHAYREGREKRERKGGRERGREGGREEGEKIK